MNEHLEGLPLERVQSLEIECADCGHVRWLPTRKIAAHSTDATVCQVARRLFCSPCREAGREGRTLEVNPRRPPSGYVRFSKSPQMPISSRMGMIR